MDQKSLKKTNFITALTGILSISVFSLCIITLILKDLHYSTQDSKILFYLGNSSIIAFFIMTMASFILNLFLRKENKLKINKALMITFLIAIFSFIVLMLSVMSMFN